MVKTRQGEVPSDLLLVSTIIPTYNRADLLPRAVASVLAQCIKGDEVIVVDDGSTDDTEGALAPFRDRIHYVRIPHGGVGRARNEGLRLARNPLIAFIDSDDEWAPGKLQLQRALLQARPDVLFCFTDCSADYSPGKVYRHFNSDFYEDPNFGEHLLGPGVPFSSIAPLPNGMDDFLVHIGDLYLPMMTRICVSSVGTMVRGEAVGKSLWFPEDISWREDWECFSRLARAGLAAYLDCALFWVTGHRGEQLTKKIDMLMEARGDVTILTRVWGADKDFLAKHGDHFQKVLRNRRLYLVRALLRNGLTREAREQLQLIENSRFYYRLLASLPGPLTRRLLAARQSILNRIGQ